MEFPDRQSELFGREVSLEHLVVRAGGRGLTAVTGRPKMGKTWLLEELSRTLSLEHGFLVGYAECMGETADLMLRAVADLYTRWLADASNWQQAKSLWRRHKSRVVTYVGEAVGSVFRAVDESGALGKTGIGEAVQTTFTKLARANMDLVTGGLELPRLAYQQACDLVSGVATVSAKPIVLVLDAWEQD